ncbi:uncharacterized protein LOC129869905 [Solanum dulcamara]|uniref:uncharacterized protein LOC129869905 n=1 Tax=Solanum dulcamara TaxID=45834 RepID=UPI0024859759|nr:uncharacterized protein LOC129869905 [Solanum dulcamara]
MARSTTTSSIEYNRANDENKVKEIVIVAEEKVGGVGIDGGRREDGCCGDGEGGRRGSGKGGRKTRCDSGDGGEGGAGDNSGGDDDSDNDDINDDRRDINDGGGRWHMGRSGEGRRVRGPL